MYFENLGFIFFGSGAFVTDDTTGNTGTAEDVWITSGAYESGDAAGYFTLTQNTGPFTVGGTVLYGLSGTMDVVSISSEEEVFRAAITEVPGEGPVRGVWTYQDNVYAFRDNVGQTACLMYKATASGWTLVTTPTLAPGGRYEFRNQIFFASDASEKMYGVSGVHKAFEFDHATQTMTLITTGMTVDTPTHLEVYKNYLWLAFEGGVVQQSPLADPTGSWALNANEFGLGADITGLQNLRDDALGVFGRRRTSILYGSAPTGTDPFRLKEYSTEIGAQRGSIGVVAEPVFFDDLGITTLGSSQKYGNFQASTISELIEPFVKTFVGKDTYTIINRIKNQYRLLATNTGGGSTEGITLRFSDQGMLGFTTLTYPIAISCVANGEINNLQRLFCGAEDGFVYELDSGTAFDGNPLECYMRFPFNFLRMVNRRKRFRRLILQVDVGDQITLSTNIDFDYGSTTVAGNVYETTQLGGGGFWNISDWDEFSWSTPAIAKFNQKLTGKGENIGIYIYNSSLTETPFTIQGFILEYTPGRIGR